MLRLWSKPTFSRKLSFARERNRLFYGSYIFARDWKRPFYGSHVLHVIGAPILVEVIIRIRSEVK